METLQTLQKRRSIRKFTSEPVSDEHIDILLHAAMSGPSACNKQPWDFYVITDPEKLELMHGASPYTNIKAPMAIVVCGNLKRALPLQMASFWIQDCSAATENILLAATDLGLGAVWCGIHPQKNAEKKVSKILDLDEKCIPLNILYIGHPNETKEARDQYNEKCVHFIK